MTFRRSLVDVKRMASLAAAIMLTQCACGSNSRGTEGDPVKRPVAVDAAPGVTPAADAGPSGADPTPKAGAPVAKEPTPEVAKPAPKLPPNLDVKDLDDDEKRVLQEVLEEQYDPCGKPRSFFESLSAADTCELAKKLGGLAVTKVAQGLSKKQIVQELLKEQARQASKMDFDLSASPRLGEPGPGKKVVVELFDYQCPHCRVASKPTKELAKKVGAVLYFKMLPLGFHPVAREAALAALACHRQGKFFEVHEGFFEAQERLSTEVIREIVKKAGVDMARFDKDLKDPELTKLLERDLDESNKAKINGTPTFYVDGYEVAYEQLEATLTGK